ncbi:MAG: hypothetical protein JOZ05_21575 [Acetobacteraceae bacterium]|nr:hypothetical protein [Acetobacteraceae bacterium]
MAGGGPPEVFKIVRFTKPGQGGGAVVQATTNYVQVTEENRVKIAEALGITNPDEQKRLFTGAVYIHPPSDS